MKLTGGRLESLSGRLPVDREAPMLAPDPQKMLDAGPVYLVRCTGTQGGVPCKAILGLSATGKTQCPDCGTLHAPWRSYLSGRTRTKNG